MRKYTLASPDARNLLDLRDFREFIEDTVHEVLPGAKVEVYQDHYTVSPPPNKGDAIRIGRKLSSKHSLGRHCIKIPKLFYGQNIEKAKGEAYESKQQRNGGHF